MFIDCGRFEFLCEEEMTCIPGEAYCDGSNDCASGDDEMPGCVPGT